MAEGRREGIPRLGESRVVVGGSRGCRTPALEVTAWLDHSRSVGVHQEQRTDEHQEQRRDVHAQGQKASEAPRWKEQTFNKATTFGEITSLSIQDQRRSLPIYKLRDPLLKAIDEVSAPRTHECANH